MRRVKTAQSLGRDYKNPPVIYVKRGEDIIKTHMLDLAQSELCQLELEDGDIDYPDDCDLCLCSDDDETLQDHTCD